MTYRVFQPGVWVLMALALWGCRADRPAEGTNRFVSREFSFEISVPAGMFAAGWIIIRPEDSTVTHTYSPPGAVDWEQVAVVVPPSDSYPLFVPFFVDVFRLQNALATAEDLADIRVDAVGEALISRRSITVSGVPAVEVIHGTADDATHETYLTRQGIGYAIDTRGASDASTTAGGFFVDNLSYRQLVQTFKFTE